MKNITTIILIIFLVTMICMFSCNDDPEYKYTIQTESCNGKIDTVYFSDEDGALWISTYKQAVPILKNNTTTIKINVCNYKVLNKELNER